MGLLRNVFCCAHLAAWAIIGLSVPAAADVFPDPGIAENDRSLPNRMFGKKRALYYVVHDEDDPFSTSEWNARVASIRSKELGTREFFAANSGGQFDIYYDPVIVDAAIPLNANGTRPGNWRALADNIATGSSYNLNLSDYFMLAYDIDDTTPDPGQGWGGLSTGGAIYLQSTGQGLINHEIGHEVSSPHARAIRQYNGETFHPYYWDRYEKEYKEYVPGVSPHVGVPLGAPVYTYGNPFDTMGFSGGQGHFRIHEKARAGDGGLGWLTDDQVPDLNALGEGTYKIYAHDELQSITDAQGNYGAAEGYDSGAFYGLTYERTGEIYAEIGNTFVPWQQEIHLEYRVGWDGIAVHLDGYLVDMDPEGGQAYRDTEQLIEVGRSAEDIDFGMSTFHIFTGSIGQEPPDKDFGSFNPPAPSLHTDEWFHIAVLSTGSDEVGSYAEVQVSLATELNEVYGDLDQSGTIDMLDVDRFVAGWKTDSGLLNHRGRYLNGDMNLDGTTDLKDVFMFHEAWQAAGGAPLNFASLLGGTVPEPSSLALLLAVALLPHPRSRKTRCCG